MGREMFAQNERTHAPLRFGSYLSRNDRNPYRLAAPLARGRAKKNVDP